MTEFKEGDIVMMVDNRIYRNIRVGTLGIVRSYYKGSSESIGVEWDEIESGHCLDGEIDNHNGYYVSPDSIELSAIKNWRSRICGSQKP